MDCDLTHPAFVEMRHDVRAMKASMEKIADAMAKMAVLEEKHAEQTKALDRAFDALATLKLDQKLQEKAANDSLMKLNMRMYFVMGAAAAVSVLWTVFGVVITDSVRETTKGVEQMKIHIIEDKVRTPDDVRSVHKEIQSGMQGAR